MTPRAGSPASVRWWGPCSSCVDLVIAWAVGGPLWVPGMFLMAVFLPLLFPDGRLPTPRWRPLVWIAAITMPALYAIFAIQPLDLPDTGGFSGAEGPLVTEASAAEVVQWPLLALFALCVLASVVALVRRFRAASGIERLQLKWLVAAGSAVGLAFAGVLVLLLTAEIAGRDTDWIGDQLGPGAVALFALVPAAIGFAVLRYRLYEIDRLVSRTVTYTLVVGVLVVVYAVGVRQPAARRARPRRTRRGVGGSRR